jgi:chemotaxis protein CheD
MNRHASRSKRVNLVQGEFRVSDDPDVVLTTLLGSCVGACIRDPALGVGGMNHFLLPGAEVGGVKESERIGVHLMELLLNGLMRKGAHRDRLEAKIFGGARMMQGLSDVGRKNADFAKSFLNYEGIRLVGGDLGGDRGRRLQFWPVTGRALQSYIAQSPDMAPRPLAPTPQSQNAGDVDLF